MVFQRFNLFPHMTVLQNITLAPMTVRRLDKAKAKEIALALLAKVGLSDKANVYPEQLSGGQQQRVAIARALAIHAAIILSMETLFAAIGGYFLLHESFGNSELLGCILMFTGMMLSQFNTDKLN